MKLSYSHVVRKIWISEVNRETTFAITDAKHYVSAVTLSTQDNTKLLQQLKLGFKYTTNWKKFLSKVTAQVPNQYIDYLVDPIFLGVIDLLFYDLRIVYLEQVTVNIFFWN